MNLKIKDLKIKFLNYYAIKVGIRDEIERLNHGRHKSSNSRGSDKKVS